LVVDGYAHLHPRHTALVYQVTRDPTKRKDLVMVDIAKDLREMMVESSA